MPQPLELVWTRYDKSSGSVNYLLLYLGENETKTAALLADSVPDMEISILKQNIPKLRALRLEDVSKFIRQNLPISYNNAYRQFNKEQLHIIRSYGLD